MLCVQSIGINFGEELTYARGLKQTPPARITDNVYVLEVMFSSDTRNRTRIHTDQ